MSTYQEPIIIRRPAILTASYVAGTVIDNVQNNNQVVFHLFFTIGSLTSCEVKVEFSSDNSNWTQETFGSLSGGTNTLTLGNHTFSATGNYTLDVPMKSRYIRISAKGTGTATSSSLEITAETGNA